MPRLLLTLALLALAAPAHAQRASFQGLGDLPGGRFESVAHGVSADGGVVVGRGEGADGPEAFRWTAAGGMVGLGRLPRHDVASSAQGVSADGSVVVGHSQGGGVQEAFRWTAGGGMVGLGDFPGGFFDSEARGVSADGSVVVGRGEGADGARAFRWTTSGGMVGLGDLPGSVGSRAYAVSADGAVVVGFNSTMSSNEAFRWTAGGGMVGLGDFSGGAFESVAVGTSADGSVVVGSGNVANGDEIANGSQAFRWTASGGMASLGDLTGSGASGVSADGTVVVGSRQGANGFEAFVWTADGGMRSLRAVLAAALGPDSLALAGWRLEVANAISADGAVVVGSGTNPEGQTMAWRAVLAPQGPSVTVRDVTRFGRAGAPLARVEVTVRGNVSVTDTTSANGRISLQRALADGLDPSLPADIVLRDLASGLSRTYQALRPDAISDTTLTLPVDLTRRLNTTVATLGISGVPDLPILREIGNAFLAYDTSTVHRLRGAWFPGLSELPDVHRQRDEHLGRLVASAEGLTTLHASAAPLSNQVASVGVQAVTTFLAGQEAIQTVQRQIQNDASGVFASSGGEVLRGIALAVTQAGNSGLHGAYLAFSGAVEGSLESPWNTAWAWLGEAAIKGIGEGVATESGRKGGSAFLGTLIETVVEKTAGPLVDAVYIGQTQDDLDAAARRARTFAGQGAPRSGFEASLTRANESAQRLDDRLSASTAILATAKGWADFGDLTLVVGRIPGAQVAAIAGAIIRSVSFAGLAVDEVLNVRALHTAASQDSPSLVNLAYGMPPTTGASYDREGPTAARADALAMEQRSEWAVVPALNRYAAHLAALAEAVSAPGRDAARVATDSLLRADADLRGAVETTQAELSALTPASAAIGASQRRLGAWTGVLAGEGLRLTAGVLPHLVPKLAEDPDGVRDAGAFDGPMTGIVDTILARIPRVRLALDSVRTAFGTAQALRAGVTAPPTLVVTDPGVGLPVAVAPGAFTVRVRVMNAGTAPAEGVTVAFTADGDTTGGPSPVLHLTTPPAQSLGTLAPGQTAEATWTVLARDTSAASEGTSGLYRISTASTTTGAVARRAVQRVAVSGQTGVAVEDAPARTVATGIEALYPNPARREMSVRYVLASPERVRVRVYDVLGRGVAGEVDAEQLPGRYTATVDMAALAPGLYVVRVEAGGVTSARAVTVMR